MRARTVCLVFLLLIACASKEAINSPDSTETFPVSEPQTPGIFSTPVEEPVSVPSSELPPSLKSSSATPQTLPKPEIIAEKPVAPGPSSLGTRIMKTGVFDDKKVSGRVTLFKKTDGTRIVSIDGFYVEPAANLHIFLVENVPADGVDLGRLVSKQGAQQYNIPSDLPTTKINSIAIYNPEKDLVWGSAELS